MMKISFILIAHEPPEILRPLIESLLTSGSNVYVHYDLNTPHDLIGSSESWGLDSFPARLFHANRLSVNWGSWSIVEATLSCLRTALNYKDDADYLMLISGSCMPIKPISHLQQFLQKNQNFDFIEAVNTLSKIWVKGGIQKERWSKFHFAFTNWRKYPCRFSLSLKIQDTLKIKRRMPLKHAPHMGSQWWCLRTATAKTILGVMDRSPWVKWFYKYTWIPDELFFQTMVANIIPKNQISPEIPMEVKFNSWGVPKVYYDDGLSDLLMNKDKYFARKISPGAIDLKKNLSIVARMDGNNYSALRHHNQLGLDQKYREKSALMRDARVNEWYSIATSHVDRYDYLKSIPNPMIFVISQDPIAQKRVIDFYSKLNDCILVPDLIKMPEHIHIWPSTIGQYAFKNPNKTLIVYSKNNQPSILEVLRWKSNLSVIFFNNIGTINTNLPFKEFIEDEERFLNNFRESKEYFELLSNKKCQLYYVKARYGNDANFPDSSNCDQLIQFKNLAQEIREDYFG
jgi:hypothetical protein